MTVSTNKDALTYTRDVPEQHLGPDDAMNGRGGIRSDRAHWIGLGRCFGLTFETLGADLDVLTRVGTVLGVENELHLSQIALRARLDQRHTSSEAESIHVTTCGQVVECVHHHGEL